MADTETGIKAKVWDVPTRICHWALAVAVTCALVSGFEDKLDLIPGTSLEWGQVHHWSGVGVLMLVAWRLVWGIVGSETNRFWPMITRLVGLPRYIRRIAIPEPVARAGHNPLGGLVVMGMLVLFAVQAIFGLFADDDIFFTGPLRSEVSSSLSGTLTGWHKSLGEALPWLVGLHVFASLYYWAVKKRNIVTPMLTGRAAIKGGAPKLRRWWWGALLFAVVSAAIWMRLYI